MIRFKKLIKSGGNKITKMNDIKYYVLNKFNESRIKNDIIHDTDIKRWALRKAEELNYNQFKACNSWINKFKRDNNIVSRKIVKFVSLHYSEDIKNIENKANEFRNNVKKIICKYPPNAVLNTDQSGINYEMHSGRTLSLKGSKNIIACAKSLHSTTHSYTIQPTITMKGELIKTLFVCLQENSNEFGPRIKEGKNLRF